MSYKIVFRAHQREGGDHPITWEPGCPLLFETIQIARSVETGKAFLQAKLLNLTAGEIGSYHARFTVAYRDGSTQSFDVEPLDADVAPGGSHQITPLALENGDALYAEGAVLSVRAAEGDWESSEAPGPLPDPVPLGLSLRALEERERVLKGYPRFPAEAFGRGPTVNEGWWLCPCGHLNVGTTSCVGCGVPLETMQQASDEEWLIQRVEKQEKEAAEREEKRKESRARAQALAKRVLRIGLPLVAAVVVVALVLAFWGIPTLRLNGALAKADAGDYEGAYDALVELGDFNGADAKVQEIALEAGAHYESAGDYTAAVLWYQKADDEGKADAARYAYATSHLDNQDLTTYSYLDDLKNQQYEDAESLYSQLYDWNFEFSLCSHQDYTESGEQWTESDALHGDYDSAALLVRATGGPPSREKRLSLDFEAIEKDTQLGATGEWEKVGSRNFLSDSVEVSSDGSIAYASAGSTLYWKAWRVTVTDPETGEVLAVEEIHLAE